jgi:hypothetical protein
MTEPRGGGGGGGGGAGDDWRSVEKAWQSVATGRAGSPGDPLAGPRRRLVRIQLLEAGAAMALVALGVAAVREHPGVTVWLVAGLLAAQAVLTLWVGWWTRGTIGRAVTQSTRRFLADWRRTCRRQLAWIRIAAVVLAVEGIGLAAWVLANVPPTGRILPQEVWWYLAAIGVLLCGAWLAAQRSRFVVQLRRIVETEAELGIAD